MSNVAIRVKQLLAETFDVRDVANERILRDDLGLDSLDIIELGMTLEDEFGIELSDDQVSKVATVGDVVELVESMTVKERAS